MEIYDYLQLENLLITYSPHAILVVMAVDQTDSFHLAEHILLYLSNNGYIETKVAGGDFENYKFLRLVTGCYSCG